MGNLTDKELKNLKPRAKLYKVTDRDGKLQSDERDKALALWAAKGKQAFEDN